MALTTLVLSQVFQAGNARSEQRSLVRMNPVSKRRWRCTRRKTPRT
jgi:hypothetical protein